MTEERLEGGISNAGTVVRDGQHVLRPPNPHTPSIHALLRSVRRTGFTGVPLPIGIDPDGRERLEFIDGDVPLVPYPEWSQSDIASASMGRLLRGFHDAGRGFDLGGHSWNQSLADPAAATEDDVICHNDIEPSNVVFRDGIAVAFIDFEYAAPGRAVYDLAQLARVCVPVHHEVDQARLGFHPADRPERLRVLADAYGLDRPDRIELLRALDDALDRVEQAVRASVEAGSPGAVALWNRSGGAEQFERRRTWWNAHRHAFATALD